MSLDDFFDVNLQEWDDLLRDVDLSKVRTGALLSSPAQFVALERYRRKEKFYEKTNRWTPTDVFLMSKGTPPRRDLTQYRGLPYRPADAPWPKDPDGVPMRFFCQLRFRESRDIAPQAQGDMLVMFQASGEAGWFEWAYEWWNLDIPPGELATPETCPALLQGFVGCYGHRCRMRDLHEEDPLRKTRGGVLGATKIGGVPARDLKHARWQRPGRGRVPTHRVDLSSPFGYFATVNIVDPHFGCPYPWVNHPAQRTPNEPEGWSTFETDLYHFNLFRKEDGSFEHEEDQT